MSEPGGSEPGGTEFFALLAIHYQEGKGASLALWMREQAPSQQFSWRQLYALLARLKLLAVSQGACLLLREGSFARSRTPVVRYAAGDGSASFWASTGCLLLNCRIPTTFL
jgi:hypothetical protein